MKNSRSFPIGQHIIFYREAKGVIEILRVLHQRMDVEQILSEEEEE